MDTFLLLYTESPTREIFARHRPGRLILASDVVTQEDMAVYDRCIQLPPVTEVAETIKMLSAVEADRVIVQTEYGLLPGSLIAQERGLPAPTPEAALLCTNKWLFRQASRRHGVPVPEFALCRGVADVRRFAQSFPIVLKPIASTHQRLVTKVDSPEELEEHVQRLKAAIPTALDVVRCNDFARHARLDMDCDPTQEFLAEEFIDAPPLETDGLVFGDQMDMFGVVQQVHTDTPHFFIEGYLFPADNADRSQLESVSRQALSAIGLTNAGFSIEFRGGVVIEVNGRLGEDEGFPDMFKAAIGKYPILKWIEGDMSPSRPSAPVAVAYKCWYEGGTVESVPASDGAVVLVSAGQCLYAPPHPDILPHLAYALATHPASSREAYKKARAIVDPLHFGITL